MQMMVSSVKLGWLEYAGWWWYVHMAHEYQMSHGAFPWKLIHSSHTFVDGFHIHLVFSLCMFSQKFGRQCKDAEMLTCKILEVFRNKVSNSWTFQDTTVVITALIHLLEIFIPFFDTISTKCNSCFPNQYLRSGWHSSCRLGMWLTYFTCLPIVSCFVNVWAFPWFQVLIYSWKWPIFPQYPPQ